eukprot:TRINITY_DN3953_c0_g1_i1.p1 TRINITY_DN3953_c0_g1~~TRINITY_DN3953_c0_g1_i1.p1  ORF type:complete len:272 (-),score=54.51 TRINITY_DN3953_c0_g1_i1:234-1049(-)
MVDEVMPEVRMRCRVARDLTVIWAVGHLQSMRHTYRQKYGRPPLLPVVLSAAYGGVPPTYELPMPAGQDGHQSALTQAEVAAGIGWRTSLMASLPLERLQELSSLVASPEEDEGCDDDDDDNAPNDDDANPDADDDDDDDDESANGSPTSRAGSRMSRRSRSRRSRMSKASFISAGSVLSHRTRGITRGSSNASIREMLRPAGNAGGRAHTRSTALHHQAVVDMARQARPTAGASSRGLSESHGMFAGAARTTHTKTEIVKHGRASVPGRT